MIIYIASCLIALVVITVIKAMRFGFVTIGGFCENIFISVFWPLLLPLWFIVELLTSDILLWGNRH